LVKGLCKLAGRPVKDQEVEQFVNLYKSKVVSTDESWELVSGDKIRYWYDEENYFTDYDHGPLSRSCMSDEDSQGFFDIYTESDTCQLLILTKNDSGVRKLIGRALVWKPFSMSNLKGVEYLMDRVYCMKDSDEQKFNNYADEMGWLRKKRNNSDRDTNMFFILKGKEVRSRIVVQVKGDWEEYPYLDTLKFLNNDLDLNTQGVFVNIFGGLTIVGLFFYIPIITSILEVIFYKKNIRNLYYCATLNFLISTCGGVLYIILNTLNIMDGITRLVLFFSICVPMISTGFSVFVLVITLFILSIIKTQRVKGENKISK